MSEKCCLCLKITTNLRLLTDNYVKMLETLTTIKVNNNNERFSTVSCEKCLSDLKIAFDLQQKFIKNYEKLQELSDNQKIETFIIKPDNFENDDNPIIYNCTICNVEFDKKEFYDKHVIENHNYDKSPEICPICKMSITKDLMKHITNHLKDSENDDLNNELQCKFCSKICDSKKQLNSHHRTHDKVQCPICKSEIGKGNFKQHFLNHSSGTQICELCGNTASSQQSLRAHYYYAHSKQTFTCHECGKQFKRRHHYQIHLMQHKGEKPHVCETCGKAFLKFYYLKKHINATHLKLRPYLCKYCNKYYSTPYALKTHIRIHTNETPFKCEICNEGFRQRLSLRTHMASKHNVVEPKTCACKVCGKEFGSEHAVEAHMRIH